MPRQSKLSDMLLRVSPVMAKSKNHSRKPSQKYETEETQPDSPNSKGKKFLINKDLFLAESSCPTSQEASPLLSRSSFYV